MKELFQVGGPSGSNLKNETSGISVRNSDDSDYANVLIAQADGATEEHGINWLDLVSSSPLIQFDFDGSTPPSAGDNTGNFGLCHTSGGIYSAGQIFFDTGSALEATKIPVGTQITTTTAISGTISMIADGLYVSASASAPYSWTLKGSGDLAGTGYFRVISIPVGTDASTSSTTSLPSGSVVYSVGTAVTTAYDNAATISVVVDGSVSDLTIQDTDENYPAEENTYLTETEAGEVDSDTSGVITINVGNTPSVGACTVNVNYTTSTLS